MPVAPGTRIAHYEIMSALGAGGMGEVWRAHDLRIRRDVAIKVLPPEFAEDAERLHRFENEARSVGSLNHPNLITIHELGSHEGSPYIVMELLSGASLREILKGGKSVTPSISGSGFPLPQRRAVELAIQFATGLAAAHERGLVHRDLKPENLFVTTDGRAKILDFGLVKLAAPFRDDNTQSPTTPQTSPGIVVGTLGYMSPEQLNGDPVDHRSDIFALGAVMYEMLTGRKPFRAATAIETMKAILRDDPEPMSDESVRVSPALERIVMRCLSKEASGRFQTARDLIFSLEGVSDSSSASAASYSGKEPLWRRRSWLALAAAISAVALVAAGFLLGIRGSGPAGPNQRPETLRAEIALGTGLGIRPVGDGTLVLSPDATRLAYCGTDGIVVRDLGTAESRILDKTRNASFPCWSPDGEWVAFFSDGKLKKVPSDGGPVQTICEAPDGRGASWSADGFVVFAPGSRGPLLRVSSSGGTPTAVTKLEGDDVSHRDPSFLPDGRRFFFVVNSGDSGVPWTVRIGRTDGFVSSKVIENAMTPRYSDGRLLFVREGNLLAVAIDPESGAVSGEPIPLASGVEYSAHRNAANYSVSAAGVVAFRQSRADLASLTWRDRRGKVIEVVGQPDYVSDVRLSADGAIAACVRSDAGGLSRDVWTLDLRRKLSVRSTFLASDDEIRIALSPDGKDIAYSTRGRTWVSSASGPTKGTLGTDGIPQTMWDWSRDARVLVLQSQGVASQYDFAYLDLGKPTKVAPLPATNFNELHARLSPDGRWLAYQSNETGSWEIYVTSFPSRDSNHRVSVAGGTSPSWSGSGRELYYAGGDSIMEARVKNDGGSLEIAGPEALPFRTDALASSAVETPDGERFLLLERVGDRARDTVQLVVNWQHLLEDPAHIR